MMSSFFQCRLGQLKGKRSSGMCLKVLLEGEAVGYCLGTWIQGFPGGSDGKESARNAEDLGSIPGSGRCPGEGNSNPNPVFLPGKLDRGDMVGYSPWGCKESDKTERLTLYIF